MGRKAGVTQSQERITLAVEHETMHRLCLSVSGIGIVHLATMPLSTAYRVFNALMEICPDELRERLEQDDGLHLSSLDDWFYVLNELARARVKLPIAEVA